MTITNTVVADYVAGRLDGFHARQVEAAASRDDVIAFKVYQAQDHARRARSRLLDKFNQTRTAG